MAKVGLSGVIDDTFIKRFAGLASSGSSGSSLTQALKGGSSESSISSGLRVGARTFATAIQGLNTAITFLNASKDTLKGLGELTDEMIVLAETATKATSSRQERLEADVEFQRLGNKFEKIVEKSKIGERELLTLEGISDYLTMVGLDKESSDSIAALFKRFVVPEGDDSLASEVPQGDLPLKIPASAYVATSHVTTQYAEIFDDEVTIATRPNAHKVLNDLKGLREQIDENLMALEGGIEIIGKNIDLVRAAGFAFLDLSDQIKTDEEADKVAELVRARIRKDAPAALSQAENLESIVVAALALDTDKLGLSGK